MPFLVISILQEQLNESRKVDRGKLQDFWKTSVPMVLDLCIPFLIHFWPQENKRGLFASNLVSKDSHPFHFGQVGQTRSSPPCTQ
jgi:hypothetical protein